MPRLNMDRLLGRLAFILMVIAGVMMCMMMLHITIDVTMKKFFNAPFEGTVETVAYYYMIGAVYLPLAYVELRGQHISVDLFYDHFSDFWKRVALAFGQLCAVLFFSILAYQGWLDAIRAYEIGEIVMGQATIFIWPARFMLPISFTLVALVAILRLVQQVIRGRQLPITFTELFKNGDSDKAATHG